MNRLWKVQYVRDAEIPWGTIYTKLVEGFSYSDARSTFERLFPLALVVDVDPA